MTKAEILKALQEQSALMDRIIAGVREEMQDAGRPCEDTRRRAAAISMNDRAPADCWQEGYDKGYHRAMLDYGLEDDQCPDAVSRESVRECLIEEWSELNDDMIINIARRINRLPRLQPGKPRGTWKLPEDMSDSWECSECGHRTYLYKTNFCPNCGMDMRG